MNTTSHKVLNSNSEFTGVLRQAVHQVQSDPSVSVLSPRRISIEIQTPPGAVVNVYISRQNDQFRAQLSTSDPQALKWVQDQVSALQQSPDMGSDVRWLPAQLESQQRDESWRGGNNQDQPTPDERNQKKAPESQNPEDDFMNITNKIKGAGMIPALLALPVAEGSGKHDCGGTRKCRKSNLWFQANFIRSTPQYPYGESRQSLFIHGHHAIRPMDSNE